MRSICVFLGILVFTSVSAQVGINTNLPLKPLHVDAKKDNPPTGLPTAEQEKNDVVIDEEGRLGVGTITPTAKLDVRGTSKLGGDVDVDGVLSFNKEVQIEKTSGEKGAYLVSQGVGKAPMWYVPKPSGQGDMSNVKDYSFMMLDGNGNSTVVNVDELFQKYLKTLTIPSVEFYASSTGTQKLNSGFNTISIFKSELKPSSFVNWNTTSSYIEILEDGKYLFTMQVGVKLASSSAAIVFEKDILIGFTQRDPLATGGNVSDLWVGRGVFRVTKSDSPESRNFTSYSTLLELKKGSKIYPVLLLDASTSDNIVLEGVQGGTAGDGVLTNLNVTKY